MSGEHFSLVWNTFPRNLSSGLYNLLTGEHLVDVTLAAEGQILRAHKLILSVCSSYFRELFKVNSCKHPIVILKDVNYRDLSAMLHFMYQGEVNIKQEDIPSFLKVAEVLQIKGLTRNVEEDDLEKDEEVSDLSLQNQLYSLQRENQHSESQEESSSQKSGSNCHCQNVAKRCESTRSPKQCESSGATDNVPESSMNYEKQSTFDEESHELDEPLNFTSHNNDLNVQKHSPCTSDYKMPIDIDASMIKENLDHSTNPQQDLSEASVQYNQPFRDSLTDYNPLEPATSDVEFSSCSKGKRSVKDIPNSSLNLETTLQVISEIGPTLRMERGKVMRMYSCPWCMRHFTRKENLKLHVRFIHGPLESLTCKLCGNKYKNSNSLRVHSYLYHNTKRNKHDKPPIVDDGV